MELQHKWRAESLMQVLLQSRTRLRFTSLHYFQNLALTRVIRYTLPVVLIRLLIVLLTVYSE